MPPLIDDRSGASGQRHAIPVLPPGGGVRVGGVADATMVLAG